MTTTGDSLLLVPWLLETTPDSNTVFREARGWVDRGGTCGALAEAAGLDFRPLVTALELGFPYEGP